MKSNNGTDVNAGQIPQILFKLASHRNSWSLNKRLEGSCGREEEEEEVVCLSEDFTHSVSLVGRYVFYILFLVF